MRTLLLGSGVVTVGALLATGAPWIAWIVCMNLWALVSLLAVVLGVVG